MSQGYIGEKGIRFKNVFKEAIKRDDDEATVVLAFSVDASHTPIIEKQPVFAFLPLKELGCTVSRTSLNVIITYCCNSIFIVGAIANVNVSNIFPHSFGRFYLRYQKGKPVS